MASDFGIIERCKMRYLSWISLVLMLGACGIGGQWMNGNPSAGKNIKPYLHYWVKDGGTAEDRREDWIKCGGMSNGGYSIDIPSGSTTEAILKSDNTKRNILGDCMTRKGYRYGS